MSHVLLLLLLLHAKMQGQPKDTQDPKERTNESRTPHCRPPKPRYINATGAADAESPVIGDMPDTIAASIPPPLPMVRPRACRIACMPLHEYHYSARAQAKEVRLALLAAHHMRTAGMISAPPKRPSPPSAHQHHPKNPDARRQPSPQDAPSLPSIWNTVHRASTTVPEPLALCGSHGPRYLTQPAS